MELSSIVHITDESFAYKLDEHRYLIRLITKKDDFKKASLAYFDDGENESKGVVILKN